MQKNKINVKQHALLQKNHVTNGMYSYRQPEHFGCLLLLAACLFTLASDSCERVRWGETCLNKREGNDCGFMWAFTFPFFPLQCVVSLTPLSCNIYSRSLRPCSHVWAGIFWGTTDWKLQHPAPGGVPLAQSSCCPTPGAMAPSIPCLQQKDSLSRSV